MTTIACNRREMAADSQGSRDCGLIVSTHDPKVKRLGPAGDLVACQGRDDEITEFERWYAAGCPEEEAPELTDDGDFAALVLTKEGKIFKVYERLTFVEVPEQVEFMTLGSADGEALVAMMCGKSPREAIELAGRVNIYTGGAVQYETID